MRGVFVQTELFFGGRSGHCSGIRIGLILCPALLVFSPTLFNFAGS